MKKTLIIVLIAAFLLGGVCLVTGVIMTRPQNVVSLALLNTWDDISSHEMMSTVLDTLLEGSASLDGELKKTNGNTVALNGKFYTDLQGYRLAVSDLQCVLTKGDEKTDLLLDAYIGLDQLYVTQNGESYGLQKQDAWKSFCRSVIAKDALGEDVRLDGSIKASLGLYEAADGEALLQDYRDEIEKTVMTVLDLLFEHGEVASEKGEYLICHESTSAKKITLRLDDTALERVLDEVVSYFEKNASMRELVLDNENFFAGWFSLLTGKEIGAKEGATLYDEFLSSLQVLRFDLNDALECELQFFTKGISPDLLAVAMRIKTEQWDEELFSLQLGEDGIENSKCILWELEDKEIFSYQVVSDDDEKFVAQVALGESYQVTYDREKSTGRYELCLFEDGDKEPYYTVVGALQCDADTLALSVDSVQSTKLWPTFSEISFSVTLRVGEEIPDALTQRAYKDVLTLPEPEWRSKREALEKITGQPFAVTDVTAKNGTELPPRLYDLTSLQVDCNKKFGLSAEQTLQTIQSLYEKKVTTYPRVDTTFLSDDIYPKCGNILKGLRDYQLLTVPLMEKPLLKSKKVFDNKKVTDHHAIIPTGVYPQGLTELEKKVYDLVAKHFIAVFYPDCKFRSTTVLGNSADVNFKATGKEITEPGWKVVFAGEPQDDKEEKENLLPSFSKGESGPHTPGLTEKWTQPPKHYTEATLLRAMETAGKLVEDEELRDAMKENGIGRPSTRAAIIETLFKRNYIRREKKNIVATPTGIELIATIRNELLKSAELTGRWEKKLRDIEKRQYEAKTFIEELKGMLQEIVNDVLRDNNRMELKS